MPIASKDTRIRAVAAYRTGKYTQMEVAQIYGIHYKTLQNWLRCDERGEEQIPKKRGCPKPVLTDDDKAFIKELVLVNPSITIKCIICELGKTVSVSVVHKALRELGFTYKKNSARFRTEKRRHRESQERVASLGRNM